MDGGERAAGQDGYGFALLRPLKGLASRPDWYSFGMFLSRYQSPGGATLMRPTSKIPKRFSSRYQSPGGATAAPVPNQDVAFGFHPVIKVRAVQR